MDCVFKILLYSVNQKKSTTFQHKRQWYRSILGFERRQGEGGDQQETLKDAPSVPPRGVTPVNPNGGGARYTARLSELYGTNSSGQLWKKTVNPNSVEVKMWKKKENI